MKASDKDSKKESEPGTDSREKYRFVLAMTILILFGLLLTATMAGGYTDPTVLAGMFSGWIVAIIGFYFMDEVSARSLSQETRRAVEDQYDGAYVAQETSLKQKDAVIKDLKERMAALSTDTREHIRQKEETIRKLAEEVQERRAYAKEFSELLKQVGPQIEESKGG